MANERIPFEKHDAWHSIFSQRLTAYEAMVDAHRARIKQFESEKADALDTLRAALAAELRATDESLLEVAPISAQDIDAIQQVS